MRLDFFVVVLILGAVFGGGPAHGKNCYPPEKAAAHVRDFKIDENSFSDGKDLCKADGHFVLLLKTLDFIKDTEIQPEVQPPFVKGLLSTDYFNYIKSHSQELHGSTGRCPGDACLHPTGRGIILGAAFFAKPLFIRASVLIHEFRHADGAFGHVTCENGLEKGASKGCDENFNAGGAYSAQLEYLARLFLFAPSLTVSDRVAIKGFALHLAQNKFNHSPFKGRDVVALVDNNGVISLFDGNEEFVLKSAAVKAPARLVSRDRNFNVIPDDRTQKVSLFDPYLGATSIFNSDDPNVLGLPFVEFNRRWSIEQRVDLLDAIRFGDQGGQALLFPGQLQISLGGRVSQLEVPALKAGRFVRDIPCGRAGLREATQNEATVVTIESEGRLYSVNLESPRFARAEELNCEWPKNWLSFARLGEVELALSQEGIVVNVSEEGESRPVSQLSGRQFSQMVRMRGLFFSELMERGGLFD